MSAGRWGPVLVVGGSRLFSAWRRRRLEQMRLSAYRVEFDRGASRFVEIVWYLFEALVFSTSLPGSGWRVAALRVFGARLGEGIVIKPRVRVKFPWRLTVESYSWIGEAAWIDNLAAVVIGGDSCVSQDVYLCTGNHDWAAPGFDLKVGEIKIGNRCWIGARSVVGPGAVIEDGVVVSLGSVVTGRLEAWGIYSGNPVERRRQRKLRSADS